MNPPQLRISTLAAEGPMQASKWLQSQVLLSSDEMAALFAALGAFDIFQTSCVIKQGEGWVSHQTFLDRYKIYVDALQQGKMPEESSYALFSSVFTADPESLYAVPVGEDKQLIRICRPIIQLQTHRMDYSPADGKFRSMTYGTDSILWGIQFSYPQLFQDKRSLEIKQATSSEFPNAVLFQTLQRWIRHHTAPTPFLVEGVKINVPVRLGKQCFAWINQHPQLHQKGLFVL
jgi:hypothetical protein